MPISDSCIHQHCYPYGFEALRSAGLSVCLSARICQTICPNFTKLLYVTCRRGLVFLWLQCNMLYTSGFVDNVMFLHNGVNRPESKTTRVFRPFRQLVAPIGRQTSCLAEFW